jgi:phage FluMu gp28-like protein
VSVKIKYKRPWLYDAQEAAIFCEERYGVCEASTKAGKTVGCLAWIIERAVEGEPGQNFWWVAPVYSQTEIAYRRAKQFMPRDLYEANESKMTIRIIPTETTIWFKSADRPDSLYGEDVYAAVIDEATRVKQDSWFAVRSTLTATQAPIRIIGNVKGRKNWAYNLARRAESGEADMHYAKLTAYDAVQAGVLTAMEVEDAKSQLPPEIFRELYLAEPADDQGNPFGLNNIRKCVHNPMSTDPPVVWGWDLAKSEDYTVGVALDGQGRVCGFERFRQPWQYTHEEIRLRTGWIPALIDSTGLGDPIVESLQREGGAHFQGFKITRPSKQQLMEGLQIAIQREEISFPDEGETRHIRAELESFEYEYQHKENRFTGIKYTAPSGLHDDCVIALALAVHHKRVASSYVVAVMPMSFTKQSQWRM